MNLSGLLWFCFAVFTSTTAIDPFEAIYPIRRCVKCKRIFGCSQTFLEAYKESGYSAGDQDVDKADSQVYLFTRSNKFNPECLHECGTRLPTNTLFNSKNRTIIIVGGHLSSYCAVALIPDMKNQLLFRDSFNVIVFDWDWGNGADLYSTGVNTVIVGKQLAFFMENLLASTSITSDQIYIIAHSYGAHIAGMAGQRLYAKKGVKVGRITGLTPYGPTYIGAPLERRLDSSDAKLVDVIQTSQGSCVQYGFGTTDKSGHADFYVNGGGYQLSCLRDQLIAFLRLDFHVAFASFLPTICSLIESSRYFIASINPCECQFVGVECQNYEEFKSRKCRSCGADGSKCAVMGFDFDNYPHAAGNHSYYLDTELVCPYCKKDDVNLRGFPNSRAAGLHCFNSSLNNY